MKDFFKVLKEYINNLKETVKNESKKSAEERSKDFKALVLTIIITAILLFLFLKVPFLKKIIFS